MPVDVVVMKAVNEENAARAAEVRALLDEKHVLGVNLMSSPGSGKTTLLEAMLERCRDRLSFTVIEADVQGVLDAERIARHGVSTIQINTEGSCHMTAHMVLEVLPKMDLDGTDVLIIENIGNLICPASFELGEHVRVGLLSVPEGEDKPDKYPKLFSTTHANVITKSDLAPHVDFDVPRVMSKLKRLNPSAPVIVTSAKTGDGLDSCSKYLRRALTRWVTSAST